MSKASAKPTQTLSNQDIQIAVNQHKTELSNLASKIGELESEAEEHELVLGTLKEALDTNPDRKCFRMIGGILVERTVKDVVPALQVNQDGIKRAIETLIGQYKGKEEEFQKFTRDRGYRSGLRQVDNASTPMSLPF